MIFIYDLVKFIFFKFNQIIKQIINQNFKYFGIITDFKEIVYVIDC